MRWMIALCCVALCLTLVAQAAEGPVYTTVSSRLQWGPNLAAKGGAETEADWKVFSGKLVFDETQAHSGKRSLRLTATDGSAGGVYLSIPINQTEPRPVLIGGWSKAVGVPGQSGRNYCVWADCVYQDGSPLWGVTAPFETGDHGWQYSETIIWPTQPLKSISAYFIFRNIPAGTIYCDDLVVKEATLTRGATLFDRQYVSPPTPRPAATGPVETVQTSDGLGLAFGKASGTPRLTGALSSWTDATAPGGFYVQDVTAGSDLYSLSGPARREGGKLVQQGRAEKLGLRLAASCEAKPGHLAFEADLHDLTGKDRAVTLMFALPVGAAEARWIAGPLGESAIKPGGAYSAGMGWNALPWVCLTRGDTSLCLGMPLDCPCNFRLGYSAPLRQYYIAFDLGLSAETKNFPSSAKVRFVLFTAPSDWGFRAAAAKYYRTFPDFFTKRTQREGLWMAFDDIEKVKDNADFGFAFHELGGRKMAAYDNRQGIYTFEYVEPMTWWMGMKPEVPRTYEAALAQLRETAAKGNRNAQAVLGCGDFTAEGKYWVDFQNQAWCNGCVFACNPDPNIAPTPECQINRGLLGHPRDYKFDVAEGGRIDGRYIDSMPNWGEVENFRREHWRTVNVPLTWSAKTKTPCLQQIFSTYEFVKYVADDCRSRGKLMQGNGGTMFMFMAPLVDTTGNETGYNFPDSALAAYRFMCYQKPYNLLLNTDFRNFSHDHVERYINTAMAWGHFPSIFQGDLFLNGKWETHRYFAEPQLYERDRDLYKRYLPTMRQIAAAGWEPITYVRSTGTAHVERFGKGPEVYFTVFNPSDKPQTVKLTLEADRLQLAMRGIDLLSNTAFAWLSENGIPTCTVSLQPQRCRVLAFSLAAGAKTDF